MATTAGIERQVRDHGFSIIMAVNAKGVATVTLKDSFNGHTIVADSGEVTGATRYDVALQTAAERMLDFQYRSKPDERPDLGSYL